MRTLGLGEDLARNKHRLGEDVFPSQLYSQVAKSGSKALAAAKVGLITFHCTYDSMYSIVHYQIIVAKGVKISTDQFFPQKN